MVKIEEQNQETTNSQPKANGRDSNGRFAKGHSISSGKHRSNLKKRKQELASALTTAVSVRDVMEIVKKLVEKAKKGDIYAAKEVLDRCIGKSEQPLTGDVEIIVKRYNLD